MANTPENMQRWARIPDNAIGLWSEPNAIYTEVYQAVLTAVRSDGILWTTSMDHIADMLPREMEVFTDWMAEFMPEWTLTQDGSGSISTDYTPQTDIMHGVDPRPLLHLARRRGHMLYSRGVDVDVIPGLEDMPDLDDANFPAEEDVED